MSTTLRSLLLASIVTRSLAINTWQLAFWQGQQCTGISTQVDSGPATPQLSQVCNPIPDMGVTSAFDYEVANGDYTYILGLHSTDDCSDAGGMFTGSATTPICESATGYTHYSIRTIAAITKVKRTPGSDVENPGIEKRQVITRAEFALAGSVPAATWIDKSVTRCSSVNANDQNIQKESCGLAITFSVVFSLITAFGIAGVYQAARAIAQTKRADVHSLDVGKEFKVLASTHTANDWIPGWVSVTQNLGTVLDDEGEEWTHYAMNHTHRDSGMTHSAILKYHAPTGKHVLNSDYDDVSTSDDGPLTKRRTVTYTAYYGWKDGASVQSLPQDEDTIADLAEQLYNYGKKQNRDQFCADLQGSASGSGTFSRTLTHGNYALIDGIFSDMSGKC